MQRLMQEMGCGMIPHLHLGVPRKPPLKLLLRTNARKFLMFAKICFVLSSINIYALLLRNFCRELKWESVCGEENERFDPLLELLEARIECSLELLYLICDNLTHIRTKSIETLVTSMIHYK